MRLLGLELLGLMYRECRREPRSEVSLESTSMRLRLTQLPHNAAMLERQLHHRSARLKLLLLYLCQLTAEMHHLSRRCLIGAATTANRRGTAASGHHALRRLATQPPPRWRG